MPLRGFLPVHHFRDVKKMVDDDAVVILADSFSLQVDELAQLQLMIRLLL